MNYSNPFRRFFAFFIDALALIGVFTLLGYAICVSPFRDAIAQLPMIGFWFYGSLFLCSWLYFSLMESSAWQATCGKKLLGLKVVDLQGNRIHFLRATARYFSKFLSRLILMIGFLMIFFTKKKQGLHDKIASTLVLSGKSL